MSRRVSVSTKLRIAALLVAALTVFAVLVGVIADWLRRGTAPEVWGENVVNTYPTNPMLSEKEAAQIAIAEIKKREGWSGIFTHAERDAFWWNVVIRHEPNVPGNYRVVEIDALDRNVQNVRMAKTDDPRANTISELTGRLVSKINSNADTKELLETAQKGLAEIRANQATTAVRAKKSRPATANFHAKR
jgi:hypothetical protein